MRSMKVRIHTGGAAEASAAIVFSSRASGVNDAVEVDLEARLVLASFLVPNRGRNCKLSLTGTAKRSTIRGGGRLKAHTLSWISGGRRANWGNEGILRVYEHWDCRQCAGQ